MKRTRSWSWLASIFLVLAGASSVPGATLDQVRQSGQIRLGYVDGARPFSYRDESGSAAGYSVALCRNVVESVRAELKLPDLKLEFVQLGAEDRFEAVKQGKIDLLCAAGAPTVSRRELAAFSIPVFLGGVSGLMRADAPARMREVLEGRPEPYQPRWRASLGQVLRGRTFAAARGTTTVDWLAGRIDHFDVVAKAVTVDDFATGVESVVAHRVDVLFGDRALLLDAAARSSSAEQLMLLERHFTFEAPALAMQRGDEDFRLLVDRSLSRLYRTGEIESIYTAHFGKPDPQTLRFFQASSLAE